jgi:hypothetical protein
MTNVITKKHKLQVIAGSFWWSMKSILDKSPFNSYFFLSTAKFNKIIVSKIQKMKMLFNLFSVATLLDCTTIYLRIEI